jgi:hypothetical protein
MNVKSVDTPCDQIIIHYLVLTEGGMGMRDLVIICVCALVAMLIAACGGARQAPTLDTLAPELKEGEPLATVVLFARGMPKETADLKKLLDMIVVRADKKINVKTVDIDLQPGLGRSYGVQWAPWVILFDQADKKVLGWDRVVTESEIISELNKLGIEVAPLPPPTGGAPSEQPQKPEEPTSGGGS